MIFLYKHCFGSFFYLHVAREKLPKRRLYEKFARKMLMKLTPNQSINICLKLDVRMASMANDVRRKVDQNLTSKTKEKINFVISILVDEKQKQKCR